MPASQLGQTLFNKNPDRKAGVFLCVDAKMVLEQSVDLSINLFND